MNEFTNDADDKGSVRSDTEDIGTDKNAEIFSESEAGGATSNDSDSDGAAPTERRRRPKKFSPRYVESVRDESDNGYETPTYNSEKRKQELLYQFDRMSKKGIVLPKRYDLNSSLEDMEATYAQMVRDRHTDASVKFQRKTLMAVITGMEFLNTKFDPFDVQLDGWSESVHDTIVDYDDIFEELHDKYKGRGKMAPELNLLMSLAGSAFMFHLSKTLFKTSIPGLDSVMKQNPDVMKQFAKTMFNGSGLGGPQRPMPSNGDIPVPRLQTQQPKMRGPTNVDSILREIESTEDKKFQSGTVPTQVTDNFETLSMLSDSDESSHGGMVRKSVVTNMERKNSVLKQRRRPPIKRPSSPTMTLDL
jgi:hypothetical protein